MDMARFARPVSAQAVFDSPEMQLRHPTEMEIERHGSDEGEGTGFDNLDPSAVAERVFVVDGDTEALLDWYEERLRELGWEQLAGAQHPDARVFARDDEYFQVQILPGQESWTAYHGRPGPFARVLYKVEGTWPSDP
jgi:hypothetical protein